MKHIQSTSRHYGWLPLSMTLLTFGLYALLSLGLTLPYNYCGTDELLYVSVLPEVLNLLIDLTEMAIYALCFSIFLFAAFHKHDGAPALTVLWIYLGALLFRRLCDLFGVLILFGSLDSLDLTYAAVYFLLDVALALVVYFLGQRKARRFLLGQLTAPSSSALFKDTSPRLSTSALHPFRRFFDSSNPLQGHLAVVAIILAGIKILSRVLYDIDYGAPEDFTEILIMAVYYLSDLILAVVFYVLSVLVLNCLFRRQSKGNEKKEDEVR